jgi:hypothetical protein
MRGRSWVQKRTLFAIHSHVATDTTDTATTFPKCKHLGRKNGFGVVRSRVVERKVVIRGVEAQTRDQRGLVAA